MVEASVRKGMPSVELSREEFEKRYRSRFKDPAFKQLERELDAIVAAAWDGYSNSRKSPVTRKAGPGFADPEYEMSVDCCMEPYATSHQALDKDNAFQENVRNVARALGKAVKLHRAGKYQEPGKGLVDPNPK
jgi:hypothetical protein